MSALSRARFFDARRVPACLAGLAIACLTGCGSLVPKPPEPPALFLLEDSATTSIATPATIRTTNPAAPTLVVGVPRAAPGYETRQIVYVRAPNELESFGLSQWVEPPAAMLAPMLVRALKGTAAFHAVVRVPTSVAGDLRLDTELVRLQQDFTVVPSRVRLTLRATLIDTAMRRVVASREFDAEVVAVHDDPSGGVAAANEAARRVLAAVATFCAGSISKGKSPG